VALWLYISMLVRRIFVSPIRLYQRLISPLMPNVCRYRPTCSEYTAQAILTFGVVRGILKGAWRIMRCNPFGGSGYDPVVPDSDDGTEQVAKENDAARH
jgi:putative membrane protein insertion efficiency factor